MPGIFVDPSSTFPIKVFYKDILDAKGNEITVEVWSSEDDEEVPEGDGWRAMTVRFCQIDMGSFGEVLEEATIINHINQKPTLRTKLLREQTLINYLKSWDVGPDGHGGWEPEKTIPLDFGLLLQSKWKIGNKLFIEYMVRSKMMDAVRKAMDGDQTMGQPMLSAAVWPGENIPTNSPVIPDGMTPPPFQDIPEGGILPSLPGFPPMPGFGPPVE